VTNERLQDDPAAVVVPSPPLGGLVGSVASRIYGAVIAHRNRRFDAGRGVLTLDRPVVSVGNLSVGGTGKTPMVMRICRWLREAGHHPVIAMRGYGSGRGFSDEALLYDEALPGVPVVARPDRAAGLLELFATPEGEGVDCILLDDGFQHRRIARQCEIVLVDSTSNVFTDRLLPAGWLREPVGSLQRADAVVLTHGEARSRGSVVTLEARLWDASPRFITSATRHTWTALRSGDERLGVERLRGTPYMLACAIGNPRAFVAEAERIAGAPAVATMILRDHDSYEPSTLRTLLKRLTESGAGVLLVTEKDWVKLASVVTAKDWPRPVWRPELELTFDRGEAALRSLILERVKAGVPA